MLDKQFITNPAYGTIVDQNYIPFKTQSDYPGGPDLAGEYKTSATPTVVLAEADGTEIDRIVGFSEAEAFFLKLTEITRGVDTFINLKKQYENDSHNMLTAFKLASKYIENRIDSDKGKEILLDILAEPEKAKTLKVPFEGDPEIEISVYEYALFLNGEYEKLLEEYTDTHLKESTYERISGRSRFTRDKEKTIEFYNKALEEYPENKTLLFGHLYFTVNYKVDVEKGLESAKRLMKEDNGLANPWIYNSYAQLLELNKLDYELKSEYTGKYLTRQTDDFLRTLFYFTDFWMGREGDPEDLNQAIETMVSIKPNGPGWAAMLYRKHNMSGEALNVFGPEYIKNYLDNHEQLFKYASWWYQEGTNEESALKAVKRAVELEPKHEYFALLSDLLRRFGKYDESLKAIEKAIELADKSIKPRYQQRKDLIKKKIGEIKKN
ncbi:hypothetical protein ACFL6G_09515 [candidate division KSB1 bacterium]